METRNIEKIIIILLLFISGMGAIYLFSKNLSDRQASAAYFAAFVSVLVGWVTYQVALSAGKSAQVAVELQQRARELEERNEAPFIIPMTLDAKNPYSFGYTPGNNTNSLQYKYLWIVLVNLGSGPAFSIESEDISNGTPLPFAMSFLKPDDNFPTALQNNTVIYPTILRVIDAKTPTSEVSSSCAIDYKDAHDIKWRTVFDVVLKKDAKDPTKSDSISGILHITNIRREKLQQP